MQQVFVSRFVSPEVNPRQAFRQHWLSWLGGCLAITMAAILLQVARGGNWMGWTLAGLGGSGLLSWVGATTQFHGRVGRIVIGEGWYQVQTLHDLAFAKRPPAVFPLAFAAPQPLGDALQLHYLDRVLVLRAADWPHFTALRYAFLHPPQASAPAEG